MAFVGAIGKTMNEEFDKISDEIRQCTRCKLHCNKVNYVVGTVGLRYPELVILGDAPGYREDAVGEPFLGMSGEIIRYALKTCLNLNKEDVSLLYALRCRVPKKTRPMPSDLRICRYWLHKQLKALDAKLVITLGKWSVKSLLPDKFPSNGLKTMRFRYYEDIHNPKFKIIPTYHTKTVENDKRKKELFLNDFKSVGDGTYKEKRKIVRHAILPYEQEDSNVGGVILSRKTS